MTVLALPKVAYVTSLYPAASHTFILREVTALEALGFDITPCAIRAPAQELLIGPEEESAYAKTFYVLQTAKQPATLPLALAKALSQPARFWSALRLAWRTAPPGAKGALKQLFYLGEALILNRYLQGKEIEHIHNHFADHSANVTMLTSVLSGISFSYTLHGPNELYEAHKWYFGEKTARARFVACISHFARSQAMYFSEPDQWQKLHIVHCGVEPDRYLPEPSTNTRAKILFIGRLTPIKGVRLLLEAVAAVLESCVDIELEIIGDGEDRAHLEALSADLEPHIRFLGYRSQGEVATALQTADMLVLPSFAEGLPVVLMEALAAGKPVICSQVAGVAELVEDGKSGFIIPAGDVESLADRIRYLAQDADLRACMGAHGRARVETEFNIATEAARLGQLFIASDTAELRPAPFVPPAQDEP